MGDGQGAGIIFFLLSLFCEFESSLVQEYELLREFGLFSGVLRNL